MSAPIVTEALTKYYGKTPGIVELDLEVRRGEVFGFLGPNGAGKTTTIRTLLNFLHPSSGTATLFGLDSQRESVEVRRRTGYLPADLEMYRTMTGWNQVRFFGALRGFDDWGTVQLLADRLDLDLDRTIGEYSSGNRQKVGIVQAFMHQPELLILDEPTVALDPLMQQEFYRMIDEVRNDGRTVFLSSHVLPVVERLADRVGIVRRSKLVELEEVESLKAKAVRRFELLFADHVDVAVFAELPGVLRARQTNEGTGVELEIEGSIDPVINTAAPHEVRNVISHEGDLERAFLAYYEDEDEIPDGE